MLIKTSSILSENTNILKLSNCNYGAIFPTEENSLDTTDIVISDFSLCYNKIKQNKGLYMKFVRIGSIIVLVIIVILLITVYLIMSGKSRSSVEKNQTYIKTKVFEKDSENRGYSDRAKSLMKEEVEVFHNDQVVEKYFDKILKQERIFVLSKTRDEYIKNSDRLYRLQTCLINYKILNYPSKGFKNWLKPNSNFESIDMNSLINTVDSEFSHTLSAKEIAELGTKTSKEDCERAINE